MPSLNRFLKLKSYPTERDCYIDPTRVGAITDFLEQRPSKIVGGQPDLVVVGTIIVVDGFPVHLAERAEIVRDAVEEYLKRLAPPMILAN